ncbi:MAG: hypothetical protein ACLGRW_04370 [Acidobacteriota bacterium]
MFLAIVFVAAACMMAGIPGFAAGTSTSDQVVPIAWSRFKSGPCVDAAGQRLGRVLLNANKYALNTWWADHKLDETGADGYLDFHGTGEHDIRPIAAEAEGLAVSLRLGLYDAKVTGVARTEAEKKTVDLVRSLVHRHLANSAGGWGWAWQSPLWAAQTARAAWLMWDQLDAQTRRETVKMLESEAAWVMSNKGHPAIKTYRDRAGKIISPGDTGAEENAWDSDVLLAATAMMPRTKDYSLWMNKVVQLELTAQSRPSDVGRKAVYAGKPLSEWLPGSNVNEDGTVINHNILHPDYMVAALFSFTPIDWYGLAGQPSPKSGLFNNDVIYNALANLRFTPGQIVNGKPIRPPGGTMYIPDSADVYFPQGNDWGTGHPLNFGMADAMTALYSHNADLRKKAAVWEEKHVEFTLQQQARFKDGHTFLGPSEFSYRGREEWVADFASRAYLLRWLAERHAVTFTNKRY